MFGDDAVVDPGAAALAIEQASIEQHLQVVADGRLLQAEGFDEMADTGLGRRLSCDQAQETEASGVGDGAKGVRQLLGVVLGQAPLQHGSATRNH